MELQVQAKLPGGSSFFDACDAGEREYMSHWDFQGASDYIENIVRFTKKKSEGSLRRILEHFGNPQRQFRYVHVAGTNGKGSVCAYIDGMLQGAGMHTGLFTSPHLVSVTERMRVDGRQISREEFTEIFSELYDFVQGQTGEPERESGILHPTYFEWLYIMAMIWFDRQKIEYGVIETGLGGRLDATNVAENPAVTVITSISYDHMAILGDTLTEIAHEKAGIIKSGVPLVCDGSEPEALKVVVRRAKEMKSPISIVFPKEQTGTLHKFEYSEGHFYLVKKLLNKGKKIDFCLEEMYHEEDNTFTENCNIVLDTGARYQAMNSSLALLAVCCLREQDERLAGVPESVLLRQLRHTRWPGRMDEVMPGVIVDGAHNRGGASSLRDSYNAMYPDRRLCLVFAVASDKQHRQMAGVLSSLSGLEYVIITQIRGVRATDTALVAQEFRRYLPGDAQICEVRSEDLALDKALQWKASGGGTKEPERIVLCAGSLYLAGDLLRRLRE